MVERQALSAGAKLDNPGPLTRKVFACDQAIRQLVPTAKIAGDWAPLAAFVAVDDFERAGCFMEVQNWPQYTEMLAQWSSKTARFETTVRRISELANLVYLEVEERHFRGEQTEVVNSHTVFEFNEAGKLRRLNVYLQRRL